MYPVMLPGTIREDDGISSFRNPDDLFPERQGTPPDRLGLLFVRLLEFVADRWDDIRGGGESPVREGIPEDIIPADSHIFQTR